jgi:plasmid stabilization system protein ParE
MRRPCVTILRFRDLVAASPLRRFADEVERVVQLLLEHPELRSHLDNDLRHFILRRFPFSIVYAEATNLIYIVAVAHGSREPGYWQFASPGPITSARRRRVQGNARPARLP